MMNRYAAVSDRAVEVCAEASHVNAAGYALVSPLVRPEDVIVVMARLSKRSMDESGLIVRGAEVLLKRGSRFRRRVGRPNSQ